VQDMNVMRASELAEQIETKEEQLQRLTKKSRELQRRGARLREEPPPTELKPDAKT
jgi:cell division protein FtsB